MSKKHDEKKQTEEQEPEVAEERTSEEQEIDSEAEQLQEKISHLEDQYKRAIADYQNLQRRVMEEKREWVRVGNKQLLLSLLPVLDTLMMANQHAQNEGLTISIQQFLDVLKAEGVTRIETLEKEFDPSIMECVEIREGKDNAVIAEHKPGFLLHDSLLRPALVVVGKK